MIEKKNCVCVCVRVRVCVCVFVFHVCAVKRQSQHVYLKAHSDSLLDPQYFSKNVLLLKGKQILLLVRTKHSSSIFSSILRYVQTRL